jgi:hypothetical protein
MRVTIEHREETSGLLRNHKEYYVDCRVEFSEEERSVIKERNLYRDGFTIRTSTPLPSKASFLGTIVMRLVSPFMTVGGLIYGMFVEGLAHVNTNIGAAAAPSLGIEVIEIGELSGEVVPHIRMARSTRPFSLPRATATSTSR